MKDAVRSMILTLPERIHADGLLPFIGHLSGVGQEQEIQINFEFLKRVTPAGLVVLVATVTKWLRESRRVELVNLGKCVITGYLQRMDVLKACGATLPESFQRHVAKGRLCLCNWWTMMWRKWDRSWPLVWLLVARTTIIRMPPCMTWHGMSLRKWRTTCVSTAEGWVMLPHKQCAARGW